MNVPEELKYTEAHVWIKRDSEDTVLIGITDFAQCELGDIVFVELPKAGDRIALGDPFGSVESVKTVSELYAPISGHIIEVNSALNDAPGTLNTSPYDVGWMIKVKLDDESELDQLWSSAKYKELYSEDS